MLALVESETWGWCTACATNASRPTQEADWLSLASVTWAERALPRDVAYYRSIPSRLDAVAGEGVCEAILSSLPRVHLSHCATSACRTGRCDGRGGASAGAS